PVTGAQTCPLPTSERERAARSALAEHDDDHRDGEAGHELDARRDGLGLPSLFGLGARVRARRIHEGHERKMKFLREAVKAHRLAVTLGVRHAEVTKDVLLGRRALLLTDDDDRAAVELGDAADDGRVIAE